jgi:hypothetical protein
MSNDMMYRSSRVSRRLTWNGHYDLPSRLYRAHNDERSAKMLADFPLIGKLANTKGQPNVIPKSLAHVPFCLILMHHRMTCLLR